LSVEGFLVHAVRKRGIIFFWRSEPGFLRHRSNEQGQRAMSQVQAKSAAASASQPAAPQTHVMGTYARQDVIFDRGEGSWLIAKNGDRYLDFASGIAVNVLGHAHPKLVAALAEQAGKLWHTSNLYRSAGQERLSDRLCQAAPWADKIFFCNSGAEACEGAIKTARRYHYANGNPKWWRIITFKGAFHGRTLATIAAAGNEKYLEGFGQPAPGFDVLPFGEQDAIEKAITDETAAIMIEPVQGEGGIRPVPAQSLKLMRELCDKHGLLLIFDEVQCGIGRSGKLFAYEWAGVSPDIMTIAKGIGGGFPLGAFMASAEAAKGMVPGTHGSTFGGNPLAMAVGNAVLDEVLAPGFLDHVQQMALRFKQSLAALQDAYPDMIEEVRGVGLLMGVKFKPDVVAGDVVKACSAEKFLTVGAGDNVVRVMPPLNISEAEVGEAITRLSKALKRVKADAAKPKATA
jgi:acetylornithine/N-succinyldiaminopimelate aminotransferase